ncbi:CLUMA_CG019017, isoform A [Clunio marinus]|uniref:CLUMA_CG019017, isoform A n=1 Tax=Clunio marinus TaxID=568069 RepID=A0A1J1J0L5_9DIPT|nr:CLUMA_CG019017, isoform A [Clunio marinus]
MEFYKNYLVFTSDYKKKFHFLSIENVKDNWTFDIDWSFVLNPKKPKMFLESNNEEIENKADLEAEKESEEIINNFTLSENKELLAFTSSDKSLFLCKIDNDKTVTILSRRVFMRASSILRFSCCGKYLFLADKTGDTFVYSCDDEGDEYLSSGKWIFGHISQILDLQIAPDFSCIVTSDRDEKIRVTNYPDTHEIEAFCLGHKEFVSSLTFLKKDNIMMSASGDKTLRTWDYRKGKELQKIEFPFVPITIYSSSIREGFGLIAMSSDDNKIYIYEYKFESSEYINLSCIGENLYPNEFDFNIHDNKVFVKYLKNEHLQIDIFDMDNKLFQPFCNVSETFKDDVEGKIFKPFDVSLLFKKKYDNVKPFINRKRARIESQIRK